MSGLQVPKGKGAAARMLADLNAEHAATPVAPDPAVAPSALVPTTTPPPLPTGGRTQDQVAITTPDGGNKDVTNVTTLQRSLEQTNESTNERKNGRTKELKNAPSHEHLNETTKVSAGERTSRYEKALAIARQEEEAGNIAVVTLRLPAKLAKYMDDYVARIGQVSPKKRYRKQDAAAEAFAAFYAEHVMPPAPEEDL